MHDKHTSHRAHKPHRAPDLLRHSCRSSSVCARLSNAGGSGGTGPACAATPPPSSTRASNRSASSARRRHVHAARWRRPTHAPRRPSIPRTHCREPWPLAAPAAPGCRALTPAHCPRCPLPTAPVTPARATAAIGKVAAAAAAAAETCCMHTAQPARDWRGTRDTRHAAGRPRTRSRRSHHRCDAPAGRNGDAHLFD